MTHDDLESLLAPISDEMPAGASLRYDVVVDAIRDARREDDASLPQGIWESTLKKADWLRARDLAGDALRTRTKDVQIAAWYTEAMMHIEGFAGLRHGLHVLAELLERYWDDLHPLPEDGDLEFRLAPIVWVNEKLSGRIRMLPVTRPITGDTRAYSFAELESAQRLENAARKNPKAVSEAGEGAITVGEFNASAMLTPDDFYSAMRADTAASIRELDRMGALLEARCGEEAAPSLGRLRRALEEAGRMAAGILRERSPHDAAAQETTTRTEVHPMNPTNDSPEQPIDTTPRAAISIRSRDEAYTILAAVADYLLRVEPHSPAPYLVKRAVAWGGLPLPSLLQELVGEGRDLVEIYRLLGMQDGR